ncbi:putative deoxyhypusine synthase [Helianthus annuus]|nr:putative deoxyhypusine synthase [Helianthus annuus]
MDATSKAVLNEASFCKGKAFMFSLSIYINAYLLSCLILITEARLEAFSRTSNSDEEKNPTYRESVKCKVFLGFTSNLISSGVRDVEVIAGGIEECLGDTYRGDFSLPGAALRSKGLNRIGNLLVPNDNYCKFEDWIIPIFDQMLIEQNTQVFIRNVLVLNNLRFSSIIIFYE